MAQQAPQQAPPQPRNIFEQIALGLQTTNDNVIDLYARVEDMHRKVDEIHAALFPALGGNAAPNVPGPAEKAE